MWNTVADDAEGGGIGELLATVAGTVATVPVILGFVTLGGVLVAARAIRDVVARTVPSRNGRARPGRRVRKSATT